jgi:hypothetical protein
LKKAAKDTSPQRLKSHEISFNIPDRKRSSDRFRPVDFF